MVAASYDASHCEPLCFESHRCHLVLSIADVATLKKQKHEWEAHTGSTGRTLSCGVFPSAPCGGTSLTF